MGKLEEIEQQLYEKEKEVEKKLESRRAWRMPFFRTPSHVPTIWVSEYKEKSTPKTSLLRHPWQYFFAGVFVLLTTLAALFVFFYLRSQGQEARIEIQSTDMIESGGVMTIPIVYKNVSRSILHNGEIVVTLPEGSLVRDQGLDTQAPLRISRPVEDLKPGDQGMIELTVRLFGEAQEDQNIRVIYYYRPENLRAQFSVHADKKIRIENVPLALNWDIPETLSRGQDVDMKVHYISDSFFAFDHMAVRVEYPTGFTFASSDPKPTIGDNTWEIGILEPGREGVIAIRGIMTGEEGEIKAFRSYIGALNSSTRQLKIFTESSQKITIAVTPLSVQGFLGNDREGVIEPGANLNFVISYRNNTKAILKNITVKALLEGNVLDFLTLKPDNDGIIDSRTGGIVWGPGNTAQLRELEPDQGGELRLTVHVKDPPPVISEKDKNLTVVMRPSISAASIPNEFQGTTLDSNDIISFKVASKIIFSGKSLHGASPLGHTGPFPPQVGQKTTYTIVWEVKNFTNDIANAEIAGRLPPNVVWEDIVQVEGSSIRYDSASNEVRWRIGTIPAGAGVISPTLTGAFQVSVTPAPTDRGNIMRLINVSQLTGIDSFTNMAIDKQIDVMTTDVRFDPTATFGDGQVR